MHARQAVIFPHMMLHIPQAFKSTSNSWVHPARIQVKFKLKMLIHDYWLWVHPARIQAKVKLASLDKRLIHDYLSSICPARIQAKFKLLSLDKMSIQDY